MIRFFCDICGKDITESGQATRMTGKQGRLQYEVIVAIDNVWNGGHVCWDCIYKAIEQTVKEKANE